MKHYYPDVRGLGNVALTRHAQEQLEAAGVSDHDVAEVLQHGKDTPDGVGVVWRRFKGIRLVILLKPEPFRGAVLVKTAYREQNNFKAK